MEKHKPIIVELFSGSKNVSGVFEKNGWKSFTVDNDPTLNPALCIDILKLEPELLPGGVGFIWASPVCKLLSRAAAQSHWLKVTNKYRQYTYAPQTPEAINSIAMVQKTVDLLQYFPSVPFIIENPIGRIQHLPCMKKLGHYRYFVNYADFGFPYSKETYLFSNVWLPFSQKKYKVRAPGLRSINSVYQRSKVPPLLVEEIYRYLYNG